MLQVVIYGLVSGLSLLFGAITGSYFNLKQKTIARFMAFGGGVLICALTFGLMEEAFKHGGFDAVIIGFIAGGLLYIGGDYLVHIVGGRKHRRKPLISPKVDAANGKAIVMGALLDGVPESMALGIAVAAGHGQGILMLAAITISSFPEGISSINGLRKEGFSKKKIFTMWLIVAIITATATVLAFLYLKKLSPNTIGIAESFAAGAILAMLADTLMPEAYEEGGFSIGILTILGFLAAFLLSRFK
jgi:ZIP family zinc transporter